MVDAVAQVQTSARELISFMIGVQEFCLDIGVVREIRGWTETTPMPYAPDYVHGVINLRGTVMPVVDLCRRLGLGETIPTQRHVIIVAMVSGEGSSYSETLGSGTTGYPNTATKITVIFRKLYSQPAGAIESLVDCPFTFYDLK